MQRFLPMLAAIAAMIVPAPERSVPNDTVILFVAGWCAPCWGEVRGVPTLARAAAPRQVMVVGVDDGAATARMLALVPPASRSGLSPSEGRALLRTLAGTAAGLPVAVVTDAAGRPCRIWRRAITPADLSGIGGCAR